MKQPKTFYNYRVILDKDNNGYPFYSIRGVLYGNYGKEIESWDAEALTLTFDQGDSISEYLNTVQIAATLPVLLVENDTLEEMGERPAEEFVCNWSEFPVRVTQPNNPK